MIPFAPAIEAGRAGAALRLVQAQIREGQTRARDPQRRACPEGAKRRQKVKTSPANHDEAELVCLHLLCLPHL